MRKLVSIVKVNNTLTCDSPMEIPYYSSGLLTKEILCFNCGIECEEGHNYDNDYFPYCEDCNVSIENKKRKRKDKKFTKRKNFE